MGLPLCTCAEVRPSPSHRQHLALGSCQAVSWAWRSVFVSDVGSVVSCCRFHLQLIAYIFSGTSTSVFTLYAKSTAIQAVGRGIISFSLFCKAARLLNPRVCRWAPCAVSVAGDGALRLRPAFVTAGSPGVCVSSALRKLWPLVSGAFYKHTLPETAPGESVCSLPSVLRAVCRDLRMATVSDEMT